ncbi:hypothetical protein [Streptomyces fulvoviolaceus]|uniref:hypothetical protein n=1 Tax=Streptomyces fulvoviolaceus TaxID=285535 RepID=UPI0004CB9BAD|nr:hypothetical protein [Streptomyces fulvoviolaceus]MCT9078311.1 hypothetical protein [Streptomyces fulvoviolaceus]
MVSVTAHSIEITAESLQEDLARLQIQKQALERELAAVVAHLGSVQRALSALEPLMVSSAAEPADTTTKAAPQPRQPKSGKDAGHPVALDTDVDGQKSYGMLTEQIMEYFAGIGDVDVRARDVAAALGRDTDSGSINAVRSTLDRLVGASRVQRAGRGLYRAKRS